MEAPELFLQRYRNLARVAAAEVIAISPVAFLRMLLNFSPHSTSTNASGVAARPGREFQLPLAFQAVNVQMIELHRHASRAPSYSWIRVKVGLVTSSASAASRAWAMPFTNVVLPVPRSRAG